MYLIRNNEKIECFIQGLIIVYLVKLYGVQIHALGKWGISKSYISYNMNGFLKNKSNKY